MRPGGELGLTGIGRNEMVLNGELEKEFSRAEQRIC